MEKWILILAAVLIVICGATGAVVASMFTTSPELCQLIPALISPEACVAIQTGNIGTAFIIGGALSGLFFGFVLVFIIYVFAQVIEGRARMTRRFNRF